MEISIWFLRTTPQHYNHVILASMNFEWYIEKEVDNARPEQDASLSPGNAIGSPNQIDVLLRLEKNRKSFQ